MLIIPALDIQDGCAVRLSQGKLKERTVYSRDPLKTARHWAKQGAKLLHLVDLDAALTGQRRNWPLVKRVIRECGIPVEYGGGVRTLSRIEEVLKSGAARAVLGTKAVSDPSFAAAAFKRFAQKVIVSIDARDGIVMVRGWQKAAAGKLSALSCALALREAGFGELIYTDTAKDGMLQGPNIKELKSLLKGSGMRIVASGGVARLQDVAALKRLERSGVSGVIIGKALYEGAFTLAQALRMQ